MTNIKCSVWRPRLEGGREAAGEADAGGLSELWAAVQSPAGRAAGEGEACVQGMGCSEECVLPGSEPCVSWEEEEGSSGPRLCCTGLRMGPALEGGGPCAASQCVW